MTNEPDTDHTVYVASALDDDGKAAVLMTWGSIRAVLPPRGCADDRAGPDGRRQRLRG